MAAANDGDDAAAPLTRGVRADLPEKEGLTADNNKLLLLIALVAAMGEVLVIPMTL